MNEGIINLFCALLSTEMNLQRTSKKAIRGCYKSQSGKAVWKRRSFTIEFDGRYQKDNDDQMVKLR